MRRTTTAMTGPHALPRVARLLVPLLGMFFLVYPVSRALAASPSPARALGILAMAALFVCIYLWFMWLHEPLQLVQSGPAAIRRYRATVALLAALAIVPSFTLGAEWRVLLLYHTNVAAGIMLPRRDAYATTAGIAVVTFALGYTVGLAWLAIPAVALGLWATAFVQQVATVAELRTAREELARLAVSEERLRFARDLHDLLGHSLSLITLKNELAIRLLPAAPEQAATEMREAVTVARGALRDVREAVAGYRQPTLDGELRGAEEMLGAAGIACQIERDLGRLPRPVDATLAWVVREGTTNVIRHSRARRCDIRLTRDDATVHAEIRDDGRGLSTPNAAAQSVSRGSGLSGLRERVAAISGAEFAAGPAPGGGFRLRVCLPLPAHTAAPGEEGPR